MHMNHALTTAVALFALMNPITAVPIMLALTPDASAGERRMIAIKVGAVSALTLVVSYFVGESLLELFRIEMDAFRVAGALVIASAAWGMVMGAASRIYQSDGSDPSVIPLSIPKTAGPGAIAAVVALGESEAGPDRVADILTILLLGVITTLILLAASPMQRRLGEQGLTIISRLFGLLLLAIAVSSIMVSVRDFFPGLQ